jgi:hypothetical protein
MKVPARLGFLLGLCMVTVVVYAILFQVMAHTRMIEKVMTLSCSLWEMLLIVLFLFSRIATYLFAPALLAGMGVHALLSRKWRNEDWSEEYK